MTVTGSISSGAPVRRLGSVWMWALGTVLVVTAVVAGARAGHRHAAGTRLAAAHVPAPTDPPATVAAVLRPEAGAAFVAPTGVPGQLLLLAGPQEPSCSPSGVCEAAPALDTLLVVDAATGATLAQAPLAGTVQRPVALAVDARRGLAYVVAASEIDVFATATGARVGGFALPAGVTGGPATGAVVTQARMLLLTARRDGQQELLGLDGATGAVRFEDPIAAADTLDGPVYDPGTDLAVVLTRRADGATLAIYHAADGSLLSTAAVPAGARLGPLDAAGHALYLFEADGTTGAIQLGSLDSVPSPASASVVPVPALYGAHALGWNAALAHVYVADSRSLRILDAASGKLLAALPLAATSAPDRALPVEAASGALYVPTEHGAVAVVRDAPDPVAHALTPDTAALLARAAVARLGPRSAQNPPFVTPATFTVGPGNRTLSYWAHDEELGSDGPYPGTARLTVQPAPSGGGAYDVSFTVTWNERFVHTRTWVLRVAPDGSVRLVSDRGDGLP